MTSGNHIWDKKEAIDYIATEPRLLRPANYPAGVPGRGSYVAQTGDGRAVGVINVMGRVFMTPIDDPFAVVLREIEAIRHRRAVIFVDLHAEATSEKIAMGWHLDGKVTAVVGTHTHVQTADERILPNGTAYLTDAGMTGPHDSIIGMEREPSLARFLNGMPSKFEPATGNPRLNGVVVDADDKTGRADEHHPHQLFRTGTPRGRLRTPCAIRDRRFVGSKRETRSSTCRSRNRRRGSGAEGPRAERVRADRARATPRPVRLAS